MEKPHRCELCFYSDDPLGVRMEHPPCPEIFHGIVMNFSLLSVSPTGDSWGRVREFTAEYGCGSFKKVK